MPQDKGAEGHERLVSLFRAAGADDPEGWADSEVRENISQLARYCFLRRLWSDQIDSWSDPVWIDNYIQEAEREPNAAFADAGVALRRMRDLGASPTDIARMARAVAYEVTFGVLDHVDSGGDEQLDERFPGWRLMELDGEELTGRHVAGLHEDVLMMDPSGREGRPR
jgi:hypothetical protein